MEIMCEGGGKHPINKRFNLIFDKILDKEISFESKIITEILVNKEHKLVGKVDEAMSHKVDFFHNGNNFKEENIGLNFGLEIEWNSKVIAFERDINNFRRLFFNSAIRLGIIITRGESLNNELENICEDFLRKE